MVENELVEYKANISDDIGREVIAFANTNGGFLYIGIDNLGNEVGLTDVDESYTRLTNIIRDTILPDVTMFIRYELLEKNVIRLNISQGSAKPYYLKHKGMKPSGVFVRQGASSVQASWDQIRRMIKTADGDAYESIRSIEQNLTFFEAEREFMSRNIEFSTDKYVPLGIWDAELHLYTNLALLLSDQCAHTIKVAVFDDPANTVFKDRREFGGSIFTQMHQVYEYLMLNNRTASEIRGLDRLDLEDYPPEAIREALLNALVHRDYSFSGSIIININQERMEFINLGGLLPGLSEKDILSGISQPRNTMLANIFFRLKHIEAYGTGIRRIFDLYRENMVCPEIAVTDNTFRMTLPNRNTSYKYQNQKPLLDSKMRLLDSGRVTPQKQIILDYLSHHPTITDEGVMELLNVKRTRAYLVTRQMVEQGLIVSHGRGKGKVYTSSAL